MNYLVLFDYIYYNYDAIYKFTCHFKFIIFSHKLESLRLSNLCIGMVEDDIYRLECLLEMNLAISQFFRKGRLIFYF